MFSEHISARPGTPISQSEPQTHVHFNSRKSYAFDMVTHEALRDTIKQYGFPLPMVDHIMAVYEHATTTLTTSEWESTPFHPCTGVKQGDPLSPALFNLIIDRMRRKLPNYIGVSIGEFNGEINTIAFADDIVFVASTRAGLQRILEIATSNLETMGLKINPAKSLTVAIKNIPKEKKSVVDSKTKFKIGCHTQPAVARSAAWRYLGVLFSPEGRGGGGAHQKLQTYINIVSKISLKPRQRLFILRTFLIPSTYHALTLRTTNLSTVRKLDSITRQAVRKWLHLPHDTLSAYIHAETSEGGLHIPSLRWEIPEMRARRLKNIAEISPAHASLVQQEINLCLRRLNDKSTTLSSSKEIKNRWATLLYKSIDGAPFSESSKVPQQHLWIKDGSTSLSGRDYVNLCKLRINAMPSRSRCARGRPTKDSFCIGGCNAVESTNHILQICYRTNAPDSETK